MLLESEPRSALRALRDLHRFAITRCLTRRASHKALEVCIAEYIALLEDKNWLSRRQLVFYFATFSSRDLFGEEAQINWKRITQPGFSRLEEF